MADPTLEVLLLAGHLAPRESRALRELAGRLGTLGIAARAVCAGGWSGPGGVDCPGLASRWKRSRAAKTLIAGNSGCGRPDLLHAFGVEGAAAALTLADGWGVPYILTLDEFVPPGGRLRLARRWCRGLVVGCRELADDLIQHVGVPRTWVEVIPPALHAPERAPGLRPGPVRVVGVAAGLRGGSGLTTFLNAARRVLSTSLDVEFVMAGHARDEADLRRRAERLGIGGRVTFADDPGDAGFFWEVLDVYCQPSHAPDPGRALGTALGHALPCVAADVPGLRSLVADGSIARLVPPGDAEALAAEILALLADTEAARDLGRRARASVIERFDPDREAAALAALYERAHAAEESPEAEPRPGDAQPATTITVSTSAGPPARIGTAPRGPLRVRHPS